MRGDPLSFFLSEKSAAPAGDAPNAPERLDPGEKALAGIAAQSSVYAVGLPWAGGQILRHLGERGSVPWGSSVAPQLVGGTPEAPPKNEPRFLGLFNLTPRERKPVDQEWRAVEGKLDEIHGVVDNFFEKHRLGQKGVTMHFRSGLIPFLIGSHYDAETKQVVLPRLSKEIALHELGHAADYTGSTLGKVRAVAEPILRKAALVTVPIALVAGDEIAKAIPGTIDDKAIRFMQDHAPAIVGATIAATSLYPEAKASMLALKHLEQVEGSGAARAALKKLVPLWGSYLLHAIPPVVGVALARKYMRQAREHNEKTAAAVADVAEGLDALKNKAQDIGHVAMQIGRGVMELAKDPHVGRRVTQAAREVGTSPEFVMGALSSAIPATAGALYLYATEPGSVLRQQLHNVGRPPKTLIKTRPHDEQWRERHPVAFAGLVGLGAALSGGLLHKLFSDITTVL
jgi:hypothetical protein